MAEEPRALQTAPGNELLLFLADLGAALRTLGRGEAATIEPTKRLSATPLGSFL